MPGGEPGMNDALTTVILLIYYLRGFFTEHERKSNADNYIFDHTVDKPL
jgi:hypothetical protein